MFVFRVLVLTLALSGNQLTAANAGGPPPLVVHTHADGPEVVIVNRYVGTIGYRIPGRCPQVGGIAYSSHFSDGPDGGFFVDTFTNCPLSLD